MLRQGFNFSRGTEEDKEVLVGSSREYTIRGLQGILYQSRRSQRPLF